MGLGPKNYAILLNGKNEQKGKIPHNEFIISNN